MGAYELEAERGLIGNLLREPKIAAAILPHITADMFNTREGKAICGAILRLASLSKPIDPITVMHEAGKEYKAYIIESVEGVLVPSFKAAKEYVRFIREDYHRRRIAETAKALYNKAIGQTPLADMEPEIRRLAEETGGGEGIRTVTMKEGLERFYAEKAKPRAYIKTGFSGLDRKTYIEPGDYVIIGGRSSAGKTAFSLVLAAHMAKSHKVLYFSLETRAEKIIDRLVTAQAGIDKGAVMAHRLNDGDWEQVSQEAERLCGLDLTIIEAAGKSVAWIVAESKRRGAEIVFIDYLGIVNEPGKDRYEKVTNISVGLHTMAQSGKITVIALSQLNRQGVGVPSMEHLRESGQVEQDADLILLLHNDQERGEYSVIVAKNKEGETGSLPFHFIGSRQQFFEVEQLQGEELPEEWRSGPDDGF